jgi:hypothetical protein
MPCSGTIDPADISNGALDPADDPTNPTPAVSIEDCTVVQDPDGTLWARFDVTMTNINYADDLNIRWDSANGTATTPTYYANQVNQHLIIPAGTGRGLIEVQMLKPAGATGEKYFFINLSVPVNCTIADSQGKATYNYGDGTNPPPPPPPPDGDPADLTNYSGWPDNAAVVYDQTADCHYYYACTGFGGATLMSGLYWKKTGHIQRFDAKKLFTDAGGDICAPCVTGCTPFNPVKVMRWMRDHSVKHSDSASTKSIQSFSLISDSTVAARIKNIKRAVHANGVVAASTLWKTKWNSCKKSNSPNNNDHVLALPSESSGTLGHFYTIVGWNNQRAGGAFQIQSTFGMGWGTNGRCWMPYSYIGMGSQWEFYKLVYGG